MKHIVFVLSGYYPYFSAVGTCVNHVVFCLKTRYHITILSVKNHYGQSDEDCLNGCHILRVDTKQINHRLYVEDKVRSERNNSFRRFYSLELLFLRTLKYLKAIVEPHNVDYQLCRKYEEALDRIHSTTPIDVIIPVCIPFESMVATYRYCSRLQSPPRVISYFFDPFSDNISLHRTKLNRKIKYAKHLQLERNILDLSSHVIIMRHLQPHFDQEFSDYVNKISVLEHPMLCAASAIPREKKTQVKTLTYAGSFNKGIREPDFMLQVLAKLEISIECNIYAVGNCSEVLLAYAKKYPSVIHFHGGVTKAEADQAIAQSDYILSVGNRNANQSPSKIFECLATGKPIIHFYYYNQDSVISILQRYPNSVCIQITDDMAEDMRKKLCKFLKEERQPLSFEEVKLLYPDALPETTANVIAEFIEDI